MGHALEGVKCNVQNCKYWDQNYRCTASAIEVKVDGGGNSARKSPETNCNTFQLS